MKNWNILWKKYITKAAFLLLDLYQSTISPNHGPCGVFFVDTGCRFYPSCSDYARDAIRQYGLLYGTMVSLRRILKCNPLHRGGYDPVCEKLNFKQK